MDMQDHATRKAVDAVKSAPTSIAEGVNRYFAGIAKRAPKRVAELFTSVNWDEDVPRFASWLREHLRSDPMPETCVSLWFGVSNIGFNAPEMYVYGYADKSAEESVWAPPGDFSLRSLEAAIEIAESNADTLGEDQADIMDCLGLAVAGSALRLGLRSIASEVLGTRKSMPVFYGFQDADLLKLGNLTTSGLPTPK